MAKKREYLYRLEIERKLLSWKWRARGASMMRADPLAAAFVSSGSIWIQTMLTLMSASGNSSRIDVRTARAPARQYGQVGDRRATNRSLPLLLLKCSFSGCNESARETSWVAVMAGG